MKKLIELPERTIIIYTIILISIIPNAFNLIINMCLNKKFLEESKKNRSNLHRRSAILFNSTAQFNKNRRNFPLIYLIFHDQGKHYKNPFV